MKVYFIFILVFFVTTKIKSSGAEHTIKDDFLKIFNLTNFSNLIPIPRIIGGTEAVDGQFPWHVILKRYKLDKVWCGGSIISENLILTAAHCVDGFKTMFIVYGTINLNKIDNIIKSDKLIIHPKYNPNNYNNDIALIKLPQSLKFNDKVNKINLPLKSEIDNLYIGAITYVTGFGYTQDEIPDFSNQLLYTNMQVITNEICQEYFGNVIIDTTLCAKGENNAIKNICGGDSGGAMVIKNNGKYIQIGINSFVTDQGCEMGVPSGFARVGSLLDFINQYL